MAGERLSPQPWRGNYVPLRTLAGLLRREAHRRLTGRAPIDVVDVGCGARPYEAVLAPFARSYVGVDVVAGPGVDVVASAEALPFEDGRFECAICSQVLEHAERPAHVVAEIFRVLRPGGVAFLSTHGVAPYHPNPDDYWRWMHPGLERLVRDAGRWRSVDVYPNGGTASAIAYLVNGQVEAAAARVGAAWAARAPVFALNLAAWHLDRAEQRIDPSPQPNLSPNYLAIAER